MSQIDIRSGRGRVECRPKQDLEKVHEGRLHMNQDKVWVAVAVSSDVADGDMLHVQVSGKSLALYQVNGEWFCTENICTHAYALLTDGWLDGHIIECPLHNGQFDIRSGKGLCDPIEIDLATYPVRVEDGQVQIALPSTADVSS